MRRKLAEPTAIYWIVDIRPETIAAGWLQGLPFYVGKTMRKPSKRLAEHLLFARRGDAGITYDRIRDCGEHVRFVVMETVPPENNWVLREQYWVVLTGQVIFPLKLTNITIGGQGAPGMVASLATRAKNRAANLGKKLSPETCARMSASRMGRTVSLETRAKISDAQKGNKPSPQTIEAIIKANQGRKHTAQARANMSASHRREQLPETRVKISATHARRREANAHPTA